MRRPGTGAGPSPRNGAAGAAVSPVMLGAVVIVLLLVLLIATLPSWPYSRTWGFAPSGAAALLLFVALVLAFSGYLAVRLPWLTGP